MRILCVRTFQNGNARNENNLTRRVEVGAEEREKRTKMTMPAMATGMNTEQHPRETGIVISVREIHTDRCNSFSSFFPSKIHFGFYLFELNFVWRCVCDVRALFVHFNLTLARKFLSRLFKLFRCTHPNVTILLVFSSCSRNARNGSIHSRCRISSSVLDAP